MPLVARTYQKPSPIPLCEIDASANPEMQPSADDTTIRNKHLLVGSSVDAGRCTHAQRSKGFAAILRCPESKGVPIIELHFTISSGRFEVEDHFAVEAISIKNVHLAGQTRQALATEPGAGWIPQPACCPLYRDKGDRRPGKLSRGITFIARSDDVDSCEVPVPFNDVWTLSLQVSKTVTFLPLPADGAASQVPSKHWSPQTESDDPSRTFTLDDLAERGLHAQAEGIMDITNLHPARVHQDIPSRLKLAANRNAVSQRFTSVGERFGLAGTH